jgi:hypothetical protein
VRSTNLVPVRFGSASCSVTNVIVEALDDLCEIKFRSLVASPERVALIEQVVTLISPWPCLNHDLRAR